LGNHPLLRPYGRSVPLVKGDKRNRGRGKGRLETCPHPRLLFRRVRVCGIEAAGKIRWEMFTIPPPSLEELLSSGLIGAEPGEAFVCA